MDYRIRRVVQECVNKKPVRDADEPKQRLIETRSGIQQSVIQAWIKVGIGTRHITTVSPFDPDPDPHLSLIHGTHNDTMLSCLFGLPMLFTSGSRSTNTET